MSDPVQLAPTMAIYEDEGDFTVRVNDSPLAKALTPALLKSIGELTKARKLTLLTPVDTKIFKLNGGSTSVPAVEPLTPQPSAARPSSTRERISQDESAPPAPEIAEAEIDEYDQALKDAEQAEREIAQAQREAAKTVEFPESEPEPKSNIRKRERSARPEPVADSGCGRCLGAGTLEGGGVCPVCRGKGAIAHFGRGVKR